MAHVVEQRRREEEGARLLGERRAVQARELVEEQPRGVQDAERVGESAVIRAGEDEFGDAHLLDATETLDLARVDEFEEEPVARGVGERDQVVDRIAEDLRPVVAHRDAISGRMGPRAVRPNERAGEGAIIPSRGGMVERLWLTS